MPAAERWAGLSPRQVAALDALAAAGVGRVTNAEYQARFAVSRATATRELEALTRVGAVRRVGTRGHGVHYELQNPNPGVSAPPSPDEAQPPTA